MIDAELAARHAPLVVLHRRDKLRPSSAQWFVERSELRWANGRSLDGDPVPDVSGTIDPARLGAAGEPYRLGEHAATALTRPLDDSAARGAAPPVEQGFFLRLREEDFARGDEGTSSDPAVYEGATTYWDWDETAQALTYWLFYPGSSPPLGILRATEQIGLRGGEAAGAPPEEAPDELQAAVAAAQLEEFRQAYPGLALESEAEIRTRGPIGDARQRLRIVSAGVRALLRPDGVLHEGDWERITLYLDGAGADARPATVGFYRHSTNTFRAWGSIELHEDTHPVVYSAIGSHASLPTPGFGFIDVGDPKGPRWHTWRDLEPVAEQPWYGFGGAWGRIGRVRESTGPLGPGAHWKRPAARPAT